MINMKTKVGSINKITTILMLITLSLSSPDCYAQDKNMLARVAYEEAEKAYEAGDISTAYDELKKVDEHLGKVTPKSQFLRVQVWSKYAERNGDNIDRAIDHCKTYLAMDKSFDLPEEKKLEVTRLLVKLEKDKIVHENNKKAAVACQEYLQMLQKNVTVRDQSKISLLTLVDFNKEMFGQLKKLDMMKTKDINWSKKKSDSYTNEYWNKTETYQAKGTIYYMFGSTSYRVKGMEADFNGWYFVTTGYNSLQEINLNIKGLPEKMDSYIKEVSAILGFQPDHTINKMEEPYAVWLFSDYTVQLIRNSTRGGRVPESLSLVITRHNSSGSHKGRAPFVPCAK